MPLNLLRDCRKIVCVGRNYAKHATELGNAIPTKPILFLKPPSSIIQSPSPIEIPSHYDCHELHHEIELGVVIGKGGRDISASNASQHVYGYVVALDMTARTIQDEAKKGGLPWSVAKGMDTFCPISDQIIGKDEISDLSNVEVWCAVDGKERQRGNTSNMLFPISSLISYVSTIFTLQAGDIILTGTPEGVGPIKPGQTITGGITGLSKYDIKFKAVERPTPKL